MDGRYTGVFFGSARIDGSDPGMRVGGSQHLAVQHAGQLHIGSKFGSTGYFGMGIDPFYPFAYDFEFIVDGPCRRFFRHHLPLDLGEIVTGYALR